MAQHVIEHSLPGSGFIAIRSSPEDAADLFSAGFFDDIA